MRKALFVGAIAALLCTNQVNAAGRNSDQGLKRATATFIGNILSDDVTLSDVKRKMMSVKWTATTPSGTYRCEADDMVRSVNCVKAPVTVAENKEQG